MRDFLCQLLVNNYFLIWEKMKEFLIQQTKMQLLTKTSISCCCWNIYWFYAVPESQWELCFWWLLRKTCLMMLCLSQKNKSKFLKSSIYLFLSGTYIAGFDFYLPMNISAKEKFIIWFLKNMVGKHTATTYLWGISAYIFKYFRYLCVCDSCM